MQNIYKEKLNQAPAILKEQDIDMWLTYVKESSILHDPVLDIILGVNVTWQSAFIVCKDGSSKAIVGSIEEKNISKLNIFDNVEGYVQSVKEPLLNYIKLKRPKNIAINYSLNSTLADGLTYGMYIKLIEYLQDLDHPVKVVSSEPIINALRGRKSASELASMKMAINETLIIIDELTKYMKPGKTEKECANFVKDICKAKGYELSWEEDHCPAIFTGPDNEGAHSGPRDIAIEKGHIINIDFGIKYNGYCSDLQRSWYVLRDGETKAPAEVQRGFDVIVESIQRSKDAIKPGVKGCEIDDVARNYIVENGYEEFPHALGHQVGKEAHDGGSGLFPRWERYGEAPFIPLEENQIFTLEPRLFVEGHGTATIEEEVLITKNGCEYLSNPQKELWLIK